MNLYRILIFTNYYSAAFTPIALHFAAPPTLVLPRSVKRQYSIDDLEKIAGNIAVGAESVLDELAGIDKQKQLEGKLIPIPIPIPVENDPTPKN
jgi:hypothetical protein